MNETKTTERDEWLATLLSELDVPAHGPQFYGDLRRQLRDERRASRRRAARRWTVRVGIVAAAAAVVIAIVGLPHGGKGPTLAGPQPAEAAVVKARVRAALQQLRTLTGTLVADGQTWRFAADAAGDFRLEGPKAGDVETYDAGAGVVRSAQHSTSLGSDTLFYAERVGVAPGPPDQGPPTWILPTDYAGYVRAALAAGDPAVTETPTTWQLEVPVTPNAIVPDRSGDHLEITVDRATGLPVRVRETKQGTLLHEVRITNVVANRSLPASTWRLAFPAGAEVSHSDDGFRRGTLADAALAPSWLPDGYTLAHVAVADEAAPTGKEGGNPPSQHVVSLDYRRGLDELIVTTRSRGAGTWSDPLASPEGFIDHPETVTLKNGLTAQVVLSPRTTPHVWALSGDLVVTVGGDASRAELLHVAESLR
jgi:hypothetical protein